MIFAKQFLLRTTLVSVIGLIFLSVCLFSVNAYSGEKNYAEGEVLVKYKNRATKSDKTQLSDKHQLTKIREIEGSEIHHMRLPEGKDAKEASRELMRDEYIEFAEPNYIGQGTLVPNDQHYPVQWNMANVSATDAWDITTGTANTKIAVIDSGI